MIAVDFLFAFTMVMGFTMLAFSLSLTLTAIEVAQYIGYASARAGMAGHQNPASQSQLMQTKYDQLKNQSPLAPLMNNGWFVMLDPTPGPRLSSAFVASFASTAADQANSRYGGFNAVCRSVVLDFQIPLFGSTNPERQGARGFSTNINAFLGVEPNATECYSFQIQRYQKFLQLGGGAYSQVPLINNAYTGLWDNGC